LEGFDTESVTVNRTELEPLDYTNLNGGTYTFDMTIQTYMGEGSNNLRVRIEKEKAYYEEFWFKALVSVLTLALLTAIVVFYVKRKTKALMQKQEENRIFIREMIEAFAKTIDMKDKYTNGHSTRVAEYTAMLTRELGYDEETVEKYYNIGLLHDIGKIGIPDRVLNKPSKLDDEEYAIMKSHTVKGASILHDFTLVKDVAIGAHYHHERYDGKGYPEGLKGEDIPIEARIIGVADAFDAMTANRVYRKHLNPNYVIEEFKRCSGQQFDPELVEILLQLIDEKQIDIEAICGES
jgi:energy-coupling factor transport system substrate-specific component